MRNREIKKAVFLLSDGSEITLEPGTDSEGNELPLGWLSEYGKDVEWNEHIFAANLYARKVIEK